MNQKLKKNKKEKRTLQIHSKMEIKLNQRKFQEKQYHPYN